MFIIKIVILIKLSNQARLKFLNDVIFKHFIENKIILKAKELANMLLLFINSLWIYCLILYNSVLEYNYKNIM